MEEEPFEIKLSFKGKLVPIQATLNSCTGDNLLETIRATLQLHDNNVEGVKVLWKGKRLGGSDPVFPTLPQKTPKFMVMATSSDVVAHINSQRSDPTIRGFANERPSKTQATNNYWGAATAQDRNFKFCRFEACSWQSFGHRPDDTATPHAFAARRLLEQLATDPGIVFIMRERELVVGTLGEMDPVDDRLMQKKQQQGACLLGYNTNGGLRIDIKLRNDNLRGFRPYSELATTLIHELSHNFFSDHNLLFWTNFGHMRIEYFYKHTLGNTKATIVDGKTTAQLAGIQHHNLSSSTAIVQCVMNELAQEMVQHGLTADVLRPSLQSRCDDMIQKYSAVSQSTTTTIEQGSPREMALRAAERRAKEQKKKPDESE